MRSVGGRVAAALAVLAGWSTLLPGLAEACSVCIGPGSEERGLTAGFYWSALLLTLLPFALAAALTLSIGGVVRRADPGPAPEEGRPPVSRDG